MMRNWHAKWTHFWILIHGDHKSEHVERSIYAKLTRMGTIFAVFTWLQAPSHVWRCFAESKTALFISELWWNSTICFRVETDRPRSRCVHGQTNRHPKRKLVLKKRRQVELPVRETVKGPLDMLCLHYKTRAHDPNSNSAAAPCSMQSLPLLFLFDSCHVNWCGLWRKEGRGMWKSEMSCYHHATAGGQGKQGHTDQTDKSMQCISLLW